MSTENGKPGVKPRFTPAEIRDALRAGAGVFTAAAAILTKLGKGPIAATGVKAAVKRSKALTAFRAELLEETLDLAEAQVLTGIKRGDKTMVIFYLRCFGKARGWVQHLDLNVEAPIPVAVSNAGEALAKAAKALTPEQLRAALSPSGLKEPESG